MIKKAMTYHIGEEAFSLLKTRKLKASATFLHRFTLHSSLLTLHSFRFTLHSSLLTLILLLATGCLSESDIPSYTKPTPEPTGNRFLQLTLRFDDQTRAEDPDAPYGREDGTTEENKIRDLNLYIFTGYANYGLNSFPVTTLTHIYIDDKITDTTEDCGIHADATSNSYTVTIDMNKHNLTPSENFNIAVVANAGKKQQLEQIETLKDLVDYTDQEAINTEYDDDGKPIRYFLMTNAYANEAIVDFTKTNSDNHYFGSVCLQRATARIDFAFNDYKIDQVTTESGGFTTPREEYSLQYETKKDTNKQGDAATVYITHIVPVNAMQHNPYLFKHLTEGKTELYDYMTTADTKVCIEEGWTSTAFTNYVVEPTTISKLRDYTNNLKDWYGNSQRKALRAQWEPTDPNYNNVNPQIPNIDNYKISKYFSTKTDHEESGLQTKYNMVINYVNENTQHKSRHDDDLMTGLLLQAQVVPEKVHYYEDGTLKEELYVMDTETNLYPNLTYLRSGDVTYYFKSENDAIIYLEKNKSSVSEDSEIVNLKYGICWYDFSLKHWDFNSPTEEDKHTAPHMKYGIVRNNIYRVAVDIGGPGKPEPFKGSEPNLRPRIFCSKWNLRVHDTIYL